MPPNAPIDKVTIHMYRMGTGDCFALMFMKGNDVSFKMLVDCGCWSGSKSKLTPYLKQLKRDLDNHVDVLVVTHEHKDHVLGFERGKELFIHDEFQVDRIWMGWTEKDGDAKIEKWKRDYGEKKRALAAAAEYLRLAAATQQFKEQFQDARHEAELLARRQGFAEALTGFAELHATEGYKGSLAGMAVVKDDIADDNISYLKPGDLIEDLPGLEGVRIFVLGPPKLYEEVKQEHGEEGESYEHNTQLDDTDLFARALNSLADPASTLPSPFDESYTSTDARHRAAYNRKEEAWRRIDHDWLFSAGSFALRMNSLTNNLSLALAIEFVESGKVLLFPGDAEFGSWKSWHKINWERKVAGYSTEKLLDRVVFYKVAHHLSHNGTARGIGLDMMTSPDLVAMATLDYNVIADGWKSTMPNRLILKDLLEKTKGRTMIMNTDGIYYDFDGSIPLEDQIKKHRRRMTAAERSEFNEALDENSELYIGYTLRI